MFLGLLKLGVIKQHNSQNHTHTLILHKIKYNSNMFWNHTW